MGGHARSWAPVICGNALFRYFLMGGGNAEAFYGLF